MIDVKKLLFKTLQCPSDLVISVVTSDTFGTQNGTDTRTLEHAYRVLPSGRVSDANSGARLTKLELIAI